MFEGKTILEILQIGGFTLYILIFCSVLSLAVILERALNYSFLSRIKKEIFMEKIKNLIQNQQFGEAVEFCNKTKAPFAGVVRSGLELSNQSPEKISNAMERQIASEVNDLEKNTNIPGTIGSTVVYIGLFGTVIGIIKAFQDIAATAGAGSGINTVISGIAEALICTASGILVAVPSVIAYNILIKKVQDFTVDMEICASETADLLRKD